MARRAFWERPLDIFKLIVALILLLLALLIVLPPRPGPQVVVTAPPVFTRPTSGATFEADELPTLEGTADPGVTIQLFDSETLLGEATADAHGKFRFPLPEGLAEGPHSLRAVVVDEAGKEVAASETVAITIIPPPVPPVVTSTPTPAVTPVATPSVTPAVAPVITPTITPAVAPAVTPTITPVETPIVAPTIIRPASGARLSADHPLTIEGTAEPGLQVHVYDGDTLLGEATADTEGRWRFEVDVPLAEGQHSLRAAVRDAVDNEVAASQPVAFSIVRATVQPTILLPEQGVLMAGGTLEGSADPAARLLIYDRDTVWGEAATGLDGRWYFQLPADLSTGKHVLRAVAVDDAGHVLAESEPTPVQVLELRLPITGGCK